MPRDKSLTHVKVNQAIKEEFLEKGYEAASIRGIAARAGITSAGLYRHYPDKEAMFAALVEPLIGEIRAWTGNHTRMKYCMVEEEIRGEDLFGETFLDMVRDVILPRRQEFKLLMTCSAGTKYENFLHEYAMENQKIFLETMDYLRGKGFPVERVDEEELHMLLSAYLTACFEPIIHDYEDAKMEKYLTTIQNFFQPGWMRIMGIR